MIAEETIDTYVALRCGAAVDNPDALLKLVEESNVAAHVAAQKILNAVVLPENTAFGFVYEPHANTLIDRRGRSITDALAGIAAELKE